MTFAALRWGVALIPGGWAVRLLRIGDIEAVALPG